MKIVWSSDIHLNFLGPPQIMRFAHEVSKIRDAQAWIITGDISEAPMLREHLEAIQEHSNKRIFYVNGNHDYWHSDVQSVHESCKRLTEENPQIVWLGGVEPVRLTHDTMLVGHDGFYDAGCGKWEDSPVYMQDWNRIHDFIPLQGSKANIIAYCRRLAGFANAFIWNQCETAIRMGAKTVVVATHFPVFQETQYYRGSNQESETSAYYVNRSLGEALRTIATQYPNIQFVTLSGHTHERASFRPLNNLASYVAFADYGRPTFETIEIK